MTIEPLMNPLLKKIIKWTVITSLTYLVAAHFTEDEYLLSSDDE